MKRTALYIGFPYTAGLLIASVVHRQLWGWVVCIILLTAAATISSRRAVWKYVLLSTLSMLMACCVYWHHDAATAQRQLAFAGRENTVFSGEITQISLHDSGYATYELTGMLDDSVPANIRYFCENQSYAYGDTLVLTGTPERLTGDYRFDAAAYYRSENLFLSMPINAEVEHTPRSHATLRSALYEWRQKMTSAILSKTDAQSGALMTGMLFGDKSAMSDGTKTSLYRVGIGHVLAVSGLHLDFLALLVVRILRKCKADRRLSFAVLSVLAILFVLCVGETVSVKRACIMILISQSAGLFFRKADMLNSISIAMLLLAVENPFVIHSAGFWLSFSGTFGIGVFAPYMTQNMKAESLVQKELKSLAAMGCVFLAVFPASTLYFREVSLISPLSNLLLVPLCMLVLLLEALAMLTGLQGPAAEFLLSCAERLSALILTISDVVSSLPWTYFGTDSEILLFAVAASVVLLAVCYALTRSRKRLTAAVIASVLTISIAAGAECSVRNQYLHVAVLGEERDCVLVLRKGDEAVIVDLSGDSSAPEYVEAYLQSSGVRSVEAVFLCNPKPKTMGKYEAFLSRMPLGRAVLMRKPAQNSGTLFPETEIYTAEHEFLFNGAVITVTTETVELHYGDLTYFCAKEKTMEIPECEVLSIYGTSQNVLPECGILMVLDERSCYVTDRHTYVGENNLELIIAESGDCRVRKLYADT